MVKKMAIAGAAKLKNQNEEVKKGFLIADSRPQHHGKAALVLEDGTCFFGQGFGAVRKVSGEVVFSTSMVGYTEALTDPSYQGQILTLTYPLVGNCGVPSKITEFDIPLHFESDGIKVNGLVIHDLCESPYTGRPPKV